MITNAARTLAVSNLGWVDGGSLWVYDALTKEQQVIEVDDSEYLELFIGEDDHFAVLHHTEDLKFHVSVRRFSGPAESIADAYVGDGRSELTGDLDAFGKVPRFYVGYFKAYRPIGGINYGGSKYLLFKVDMAREAVEFHELEWFTNKHYDLGYQGITGVKEVSRSGRVVVSIQRASHSVLYDSEKRRVVRRIPIWGHKDRNNESARMCDGKIVARDWKTGTLL